MTFAESPRPAMNAARSAPWEAGRTEVAARLHDTVIPELDDVCPDVGGLPG